MRCLLFLLAGLLGAQQLAADEFRPALLEITETRPGAYHVLWKVPQRDGQPLALSPVLPANMERLGPPSIRKLRNDVIEESSWRTREGSLIGATVGIDGLRSMQIDVILQIALADGSEYSAILRPTSPTYSVPEAATAWTVAASYWKIGTIHILEGYDHLLFVLALVLIVPNLWMLVKTITAFTLAHSVSLALATLGVVNMPAAPTEAVIALSILFLAVEILHSRQGRTTLTERYPWVVALGFGLFHGLGFAGALAEVGLPQQQIPLALLMFNVGVETGQLLFVAVALAALGFIRWLPVSWPRESWRILPYAIGSIAAFWTVQRVGSFML